MTEDLALFQYKSMALVRSIGSALYSFYSTFDNINAKIKAFFLRR